MPGVTAEAFKIVIVGGGSAGWLTAGVIAAECQSATGEYQVSLIESPDVPTIGVGEGTWPSMRSTLQRIGLSETRFLRDCDASFKQGTFFRDWCTGNGDTYAHPFSVPADYASINLAPHWLALANAPPYADAVTAQTALFETGIAPKQITTPEYALVVNYGYHLDAGKFAELLREHCTGNLGVVHISANVQSVQSAENGDIEAVNTDRTDTISGDLFIDCTGSRSLLLGEHFGIPFQSAHNCLFNDTALAAQVPYADEDQAIPSCTLSTAQTAGWIWDIALPTRRGIGHVYSSAHISEDEASQQLLSYIEATAGNSATVSPRKIAFQPGFREQFWHRNCVAIGMSSGFIEPLEASALVLVEMGAAMIADHLSATRDIMDIVAKRYNDRFQRHWQQIIEFLKLHYVLSARDDSAYWQDNRASETIPDKLREQIALWHHRSIWHQDAESVDDLFPTASYQYVLYGMGFRPETACRLRDAQNAAAIFQQNATRREHLKSALPGNRELLEKVRIHGLQPI